MTRKDQAVLIWGGDFYDDEHVLQMNLEQQGAYWRLLWLSWRNRGLPHAESEIAAMLGVTPRRFATKLWPGIRACWTEHEGRWVQKRQEQERARREESRDGEPDGEKSERMAELARLSWAARRARADAASHATQDAPRIAHADAARNAELQCGPQSPPRPPSVQKRSEVPLTRNADAQCAAHVRPAEGASAASAEETDPECQLQLALLKTPYRSKLPGFDRSRELRRAAVRLLATGLTPEDVEALDALDAEKADTRGALLAKWLDEENWRGVLDEQRMKKKQRSLRAAAKSDPLEGVYGGDPIPAASVIDGVLKGAQAGG